MIDALKTASGLALGLAFVFGLPWILAIWCVVLGGAPGVCGM